MKFPNKVTTYKQSSIARFPEILNILKTADMSPKTLYQKVKSKVADIDEFVDVIACLYATGKVKLNGEVLHYVD